MIVRFRMTGQALLFLCFTALSQASTPTPTEFFGFRPGDDYKLANYQQITGYFQALARASDRIRVVEYGRSSFGKPMYVAFLSAPENLAKLEHYRDISRRLALGRMEASEARALSAVGKAVVWIDSGLHASEVAPVQHAPELAYRMVTGEDEETRAIRQNVILMQIPVINPDGLDWIVDWYRQNLGTPYESAPLPRLYQKYAGHDNNRDWFMLNLDETRHTARLLFHDWFPQIVYNQHQAPAFPARIFIPPYAEPLNPHIPAAVMEGINLIGMAMRERFARENKPGILSYFGFDAWWDGGLRSVPAFHNMHGILTETALYSYATPRTYDRKDFPASFGNGMPTREPSIFYERPWMGGKWGTRDAIDYMLTADFAILSHAAAKRTDYLLKSYEMARASIEAGEKGAPYAYIIAPEQWDGPAGFDMLERLSLAGVDVKRAKAPFHAGSKQYPAGTYVLPAAQAFRPYLMDLLEPQKYPELRPGTSGPTKRPYDITGWTLSMQMGVAVDRVENAFDARLETVEQFRPEGSVSGSGSLILMDHRENASFVATAFLMDRNERVQWAPDGSILVDSAYVSGPARVENFARQFGVHLTLADKLSATPALELKRPRTALYEPWVANPDTGWTEWLLERYHVPYTLLHNDEFRKSDLRSRFDTIILAAQSPESILHGFRPGETTSPDEQAEQLPAITVQRPEYAGGIELAGLSALQQFVTSGGTLIALDTATELPIRYFPLSLKNAVRSGSDFYCPGSLIRLTLDNTQPIAFGMPKEAIAFSTGGEAFDVTLAGEFNKGEREIHTVARFEKTNLLASGWVSGAQVVAGKAALADVRYGHGRVVLFGFRPQFRGQPFGTFKLLLNAIYLGSAQPL